MEGPGTEQAQNCPEVGRPCPDGDAGRERLGLSIPAPPWSLWIPPRSQGEKGTRQRDPVFVGVWGGDFKRNEIE